MKLDQYLFDAGIKPKAFADNIGVAPSTITRLLKGERSPRIALIALIEAQTGGAVTARDFMPSAQAPTQGAAA